MSVKIHFKNDKIATQKVEIKDAVINKKFGDCIEHYANCRIWKAVSLSRP